MREGMKAYVCWCPAIDGDPVTKCGIHLAETASKARYKSLLQALDAGFDNLTFADIRVRRAPFFDRMNPKDGGKMPEYIGEELCVIWSGEHDGWWGPNRAGYYTDVRDAGVYGRSEAERLIAGSPEKKQRVLPLRDLLASETEEHRRPGTVGELATIRLIAREPAHA